jgi:hypothetical protein
MSEVSGSAHVRLLLADYGVVDSQGKITIVGGGITIAGIPPNTNATAPFAVLGVIDFDQKYVGQRVAMELALEQDNGDLVPMPGAPDSADHAQYVRIAANEELKSPTVTWGRVPYRAVRPRHTLMLMFQNGLPLRQGHTYTWRLKIDDETRDEWTEEMYVPAPLLG